MFIQIHSSAFEVFDYCSAILEWDTNIALRFLLRNSLKIMKKYQAYEGPTFQKYIEKVMGSFYHGHTMLKACLINKWQI